MALLVALTLASCGNVFTELAVGPVVAMALSEDTQLLAVGMELRLSASAIHANGDGSVELTWSSSDDTVVTVDSSGLLTGIAAGAATVTAASSGFTRECAVTVTPEDGTAAHPWLINSPERLNAMRGGQTGYPEWDLSDHYLLVADIDLSVYASGEGWVPIGSYDNAFNGSLDGDDRTIRNLTIHRPEDYQGLFGFTLINSQISGLILEGVNISGSSCVGGIVGASFGNITGCSVSGSISGKNSVGGITGGCNNGNISDCFTTGNVSGIDSVGGLVGFFQGSTIYRCYTTGAISGITYVGGFMGAGLGIYIYISDCYATGPVEGRDGYGGFVGKASLTSSRLSSCYATGVVSGTGADVGGFVGFDSSSTDACYYDEDTTSRSDTNGESTPKTTAEMKTQATFSGWDFTTIWAIDPGYNSGYPYLRWERE